MKLWLRRVLDSFWKTLALVAVCSFVLTLGIECLGRHNILKGLSFLVTNPYMFLVNYLLIFATMLLSLFARRRSFALVFTGGIWLVIGLVNWHVVGYRDMPFTAMDILKVTSVLGVTFKYFKIWQVIGIGILIAVSIAALVYLFLHSKKRPVKGSLKKSVSAFAVTALLTAGLIVGGRMGGLIPKNLPNVLEACRTYGYPFCFSSSVVRRGVFEPEDYTPKTAVDVLALVNEESELTGNLRPNFIFVQLESFIDPTYLKTASYSEDPLPNYHRIRERGLSGLLTVPTTGAGTVNTEFEVLTGLSVDNFGLGEYPFKTVMPEATAESIAYNLGTLGYTSHFIHNNDGDFYERDEVYGHLGFDTFTSVEFMQGIEMNVAGAWPRDAVLTEEIFSALGRTSGQDMVMTVTVQSHGKYPPSTMPEGHDYPIAVTLGETEIDPEALTYYVNELKDVDAFIGELYQRIQTFSEKTVVVMYGDHFPTMGITEEDLSFGSVMTTEYVVFTNFGLEKAYGGKWRAENTVRVRNGLPPVTSVSTERVTFGDIPAYQLYALVLDMANIHEGILPKFHQTQRDDENYDYYLNILEYDMLGDNRDGDLRNVYEGEEYFWPVHTMFFGPEDLTITSYHYEEDGYLYVEGSGFTPYCKIMDQEDPLEETEFISENLLRVELKDPWKVQVGVVSSAGKVLRLITFELEEG